MTEPLHHILYRFYDTADRLLYIGMTTNMATRLSEHRLSKNWWSEIARIELEHYGDRLLLRQAEVHAIRNENPVYNALGRGRGGPLDAMQIAIDLHAAGKALSEAKAALSDATDAARQAAIEAVDVGISEAEVARELGVTRMTVRSWLGK